MKVSEILESMKADTNLETLLEAIEKLNQECENAAAEASRAEKAYYADAHAKKKRLDARVEDLHNQLKACDATIESFKEPLVAATISGDKKKLEEIKAQMKEQEIEKSQLDSEINLLKSTHVKGDVDLYNAVEEKFAAHIELVKEYRAAKKEVYTLADQKIEDYERVQRHTKYYNLGGGYGPDMEELRRHFTSNVPIEISE